MAMTVNGIIAGEQNEEDFLSDDHWTVFCELARKIGCLVIGRKTYDVVRTWKDYNFEDLRNVVKIVVSRNTAQKLGKEYILAQSPRDALGKAESLGFEEVLLAGGANINTAFAKERLLNDVILSVEPLLLGKGITVFSPGVFEVRLKLLDIRKISQDIVQLYYRVE